MRKPLTLPIAKIAIAAFFGLALCFAQESPPKLAVYVSGSGDAGVNKLLGSKLLVAMSQSGEYAEISDPGSFQDGLASLGGAGIAQAAQAASRYGADYVCTVDMTEAFGAYSITARLARVSDSQVVKIGSADRALKSLEDLTVVSVELARQLLPPGALAAAAIPPPLAAAVPPAEAAAPVVAQKQCARTYNINELIFKVKDGFPRQLKDCSSKLAKDMLTPASLGGKKLEPKSFMMQCPVDGIKKELPDGFPGADKLIGSLSNFVQGLLSSAMAGGGLDPKKLVSAVASMDINGLLNELKNLASGECMTDEPYTPPAVPEGGHDEGKGADAEEKSSVSFGIRAGFNFSHVLGEYGSYGATGTSKDVPGMQAGFVLDIAAADWFHIQPGLMYAQKGMRDNTVVGYYDITAHYLEIPLLLSLKFSALRLNAGPYLGTCLSGNYACGVDLGLSMGFGFDIGMFYMGMFYDYGLGDVSSKHGYDFYFYNRTLGFNLGVNL